MLFYRSEEQDSEKWAATRNISMVNDAQNRADASPEETD